MSTSKAVPDNEKLLRATLSPVSFREGDSTPVTVRGKEGRYFDNGEVVVQLEDGRWLDVSGGYTRDELVRTADTMDIRSFAPREWIGTR